MHAHTTTRRTDAILAHGNIPQNHISLNDDHPEENSMLSTPEEDSTLYTPEYGSQSSRRTSTRTTRRTDAGLEYGNTPRNYIWLDNDHPNEDGVSSTPEEDRLIYTPEHGSVGSNFSQYASCDYTPPIDIQ